jgi:glyoxylase-like metal-dependent hydrolase (beta-lactamase superfamily II)
MCHPYLRRPYDVEHVCLLIRALYGDRLEFVKADREIAPGISVHHVGGHTPGLQVARVRTARGWVVLASDAMHFYENWTKATPFPVLVNLDEYLDAFKKIEGLADSHDHIVAGHDPLVINAYPPVSGMQGVACQLHVPPRSGMIFS